MPELLLIPVGILLVLLLSALRLNREYARAVVFRLGRLRPLRGPGLSVLAALRRVGGTPG